VGPHYSTSGNGNVFRPSQLIILPHTLGEIYYSNFCHTLCIMLWWPSLSLFRLNSPILLNPKQKNSMFCVYTWATVRKIVYTQIDTLHPAYIGFCAQNQKYFEFSMPSHGIHTLWPFICWKLSDSTLKFSLETIN
jgi:hypothetical protein